ncbi:hypothetical protein EST38_g6966 [Candolleomyces aberdarensis]|uniref:Uncharacterized protein n=1 Tax=Candolleomyces aberdarensis TaxID=2316362 RepID=A0A4Q2DGB9_9AGAR|nr:hypothetical protein EST38_g6966 [Candolleomyces aberdarensis]
MPLSFAISTKIIQTSLPLKLSQEVTESESKSSAADFYASTGPMNGYLRNIGQHRNLASFWDANMIKLGVFLESLVCFDRIDPSTVIDLDGVSHIALVVVVGRDTLSGLSLERATEAMVACKDFLREHQVEGVECLIQMGSFNPSAAHPLQVVEADESAGNPESLIPFTSSLGVAITTTQDPDLESTRGFFITAADKLDGKIYFLICRHGLGTGGSGGDDQQPITILQPPNSHFTLQTPELLEELGTQVDALQLRLSKPSRVMTDLRYTAALAVHIGGLGEALSISDACNKEEQRRAIGVVRFKPDICWSEDFTFDVAVCEADSSRFNPTNFRGNIVDIGDANRAAQVLSDHGLLIPADKLLPLHGVVPIDEIRNWAHRSDDDLMMGMRGGRSGVVVGRASALLSLKRTERNIAGLPSFFSRECIVHAYDDDPSKPFSVPGDSGATVFDTQGRILGILTGGYNHQLGAADRSYVTPAEFLLSEIGRRWKKVDLYEEE